MNLNNTTEATLLESRCFERYFHHYWFRYQLTIATESFPKDHLKDANFVFTYFKLKVKLERWLVFDILKKTAIVLEYLQTKGYWWYFHLLNPYWLWQKYGNESLVNVIKATKNHLFNFSYITEPFLWFQQSSEDDRGNKPNNWQHMSSNFK